MKDQEVKKININKLLAHPLCPRDTELSIMLWPEVKATSAQSKFAKKKKGLNYNRFTKQDQERINTVINQFINDITEG